MPYLPPVAALIWTLGAAIMKGDWRWSWLLDTYTKSMFWVSALLFKLTLLVAVVAAVVLGLVVLLVTGSCSVLWFLCGAYSVVAVVATIVFVFWEWVTMWLTQQIADATDPDLGIVKQKKFFFFLAVYILIGGG